MYSVPLPSEHRLALANNYPTKYSKSSALAVPTAKYSKSSAYTQEWFILTYCIIVNVLNTHRWFGHIHVSHVLGLQDISTAAILQEFPEVDLNYMSHTYIHTYMHTYLNIC